MKKILSAMISAALILCMTACGNTENTPQNNSLGGNSEMNGNTQSTASETVSDAVETVMTEVNAPDDFVLIKGGSFQMGSPETDNWRGNDETLHNVTVSDFYIKLLCVAACKGERACRKGRLCKICFRSGTL